MRQSTVGKRRKMECGGSSITDGGRSFGAIRRSSAAFQKDGGTDRMGKKETFGRKDFQEIGPELMKGTKPWWSVWEGKVEKRYRAQTKSVGVGNDVVNERNMVKKVDIAVGVDAELTKQAEVLVKSNADTQGVESKVGSDVPAKEGEVSGKDHLKRLPYMGIAMPLGSHLSEKTRRKIWSHEMWMFLDYFIGTCYQRKAPRRGNASSHVDQGSPKYRKFDFCIFDICKHILRKTC